MNVIALSSGMLSSYNFTLKLNNFVYIGIRSYIRKGFIVRCAFFIEYCFGILCSLDQIIVAFDVALVFVMFTSKYFLVKRTSPLSMVSNSWKTSDEQTVHRNSNSSPRCTSLRSGIKWNSPLVASNNDWISRKFTHSFCPSPTHWCYTQTDIFSSASSFPNSW